MKDAAQRMIEQLEAEKARREEASKALWRMTPEDRRAAMCAGRLTGTQLFERAKKAPHEVPLINNEFVFIAAMTPEVAEAGEHDEDDRDA